MSEEFYQTGQAGALEERFEAWQNIAFDELQRVRKDIQRVSPGEFARHRLIEHWVKLKFGLRIYFRASRPVSRG
jgi:hypothetical protein